MRMTHSIGWRILLFPLALSVAGAGEKLTDRLSSAVASRLSDDRFLVWITFTDKGGHELQRASVPRSVVTPRSIQRRLNVLPSERVVDDTDLTLEQSYVDQISVNVSAVRQRSRWFNSVSALVTRDELQRVERLACVQTIDLVTRFKKNPANERVTEVTTQELPDGLNKAAKADSINYGPSRNQLNLMNVPAIHSLGNHAEGVLVGVFDNGFRLLNHQVFDTLRPRIVATYDFVDHKVNVAPNNLNSSFGSHGVSTLSAIGGCREGALVGPAYGASFILARTENDSSETPIEEDNWVAAIEWADSIGVQVTSTSLGYLAYDSPYFSLTWQDMNGQTALISRAATMAARKGIVICNSAGNEGSNPQHNTLMAPADADSILTVGAVDPWGIRAYFSSVGPTTDGRIKPDVMAQGMSVYVASGTNPVGFGYGSGTSFSCPLAAGVAALLVKAKPTATPMQIINALRMTASQNMSPDNSYGWGIIDALAALNRLNTTDTGTGKQLPSSYALSQNYPNPFNPETHIDVDLPVTATMTLKIYDVLGREVATLASETRTAGRHVFTWNGNTSRGAKASSGVYFARLEVADASGATQRFLRKLMMVK